MKTKTTAAYIAALFTTLTCLILSIWSYTGCLPYTSRLIGSAGIILTISGFLQLEVSGLIERLVEKYSDEKNHPYGAPSRINRYIIDNPDRPIRTKLRNLFLYRTKTAFWLFLTGAMLQLIATWIPNEPVSRDTTRWWQTMNASEQAAWIQAIGSIVAIFVAIAVPFFSNRTRRNERVAEMNQRSKNATLVLYPTLLDLQRSLSRFVETNSAEYDKDEETINVDPHDGDFQSHFEKLLAKAPILDTLPIEVAVSLRELLAEIISAQHWLDSIPAIQSSGNPGFYRNNLDYILERAIALEQLSSKAINACSNLVKG